MITGVELVYAVSGAPYGGGPSVAFERSEIVSFGKVRYYGDFTVRYVVKLADGRAAFVNASVQRDEGDRKWLQRLGRKLGYEGPADRGGWAVKWRAVDDDGELIL